MVNHNRRLIVLSRFFRDNKKAGEVLGQNEELLRSNDQALFGRPFFKALHRKANGNKENPRKLGPRYAVVLSVVTPFGFPLTQSPKGRVNSPVQDRIDTPFGRASHQYVVVGGGEDVVPQEEVVPTVVDTDRKGMYLSVVSTPQHPVDIVPRQKLVNKALVHQTILDLKLSEIKGDLPLGGRTRFFRHNWEKITQDFQVLEAITGYKLDLIANPVQHKGPHVPNFSAAERVQIDVEIADMLNKEAIEEQRAVSKSHLSKIEERPVVPPSVQLEEIERVHTL